MAMDNGFVKLYRSIRNWEWYDDSVVKSVFLHCLLKANYEERQWRGITLEVGSFVTSYQKMATELKLSVQQIRTALNKLKSTGEVTCTGTNKYTIVKVLNFSSYQDDNKQTNKQITNNQQTNNKQITTDKELKEYKERKEVKNIKTYSDLINEFSSDLALRTELENFVEMRKKEKGFTVHALELNLKKLEGMSSDPSVQTEIVRQSIERSWKGLFPLKGNQSVQKVQPNQRQDIIPDWKAEEQQSEDVDWEEFQKIREQLREIENGVK